MGSEQPDTRALSAPASTASEGVRRCVVGFFVAAAAVCGLSAVTLLRPGTVLDGIWAPKEAEHAALAAQGPLAGWGLALLAAVLAAGAVGWWRRRRWGWWVGVVVVGANLAGDVVQAVRSRDAVQMLPVLLAAALLAWMAGPARRRHFPAS